MTEIRSPEGIPSGTDGILVARGNGSRDLSIGRRWKPGDPPSTKIESRASLSRGSIFVVVSFGQRSGTQVRWFEPAAGERRMCEWPTSSWEEQNGRQPAAMELVNGKILEAVPRLSSEDPRTTEERVREGEKRRAFAFLPSIARSRGP